MDSTAFRKLSKVLPVLLLCIETLLLAYWWRHIPTYVTVDIQPFVHKEAIWLVEQKVEGQALQQELEGFRKRLIEDLTLFAKSKRYLVAMQGMLAGDLKDVTEDFMAFRGEIGLRELRNLLLKK